MAKGEVAQSEKSFMGMPVSSLPNLLICIQFQTTSHQQHAGIRLNGIVVAAHRSATAYPLES
jgi:hypothetical protein